MEHNNNNRGPRRERPERPVSDMFERVIQVNRVSKKTKGGDKRSLSVIVVVGDRQGRVGVGLGKAADVQSAVAKATTKAKRQLITIPLKDNRTIAHEVYVKQGAAKILIKPAPSGTGVIAGGAVRVIAEAAGIKDVVAKILGTKNKASNVHAALEGFSRLKPARVVEEKIKAEIEKAVEIAEEKKPAKAKAKK